MAIVKPVVLIGNELHTLKDGDTLPGFDNVYSKTEVDNLFTNFGVDNLDLDEIISRIDVPDNTTFVSEITTINDNIDDRIAQLQQNIDLKSDKDVVLYKGQCYLKSETYNKLEVYSRAETMSTSQIIDAIDKLDFYTQKQVNDLIDNITLSSGIVTTDYVDQGDTDLKNFCLSTFALEAGNVNIAYLQNNNYLTMPIADTRYMKSGDYMTTTQIMNEVNKLDAKDVWLTDETVRIEGKFDGKFDNVYSYIDGEIIDVKSWSDNKFATTSYAQYTRTLADTNATNIGINKSDIASNKAKIDSHTTSIYNLNSDMNTLEGLMSTLRSDMSDLQGDVGSYTTRINSVESSISSVQTDIGTLQNEMTGLQTTVGGYTSRITSVEGRVDSLVNDMTALENNVGGYTSRISAVEGTVSTLNGSMSTLQSTVLSLESNVNGYSENITNAVNTANSAANDVSVISDNITSLTNTVNGYSSDIISLQNDVSNHSGRISANEGNITNVTNTVNTFNVRIGTNESDISSLQGSLSNLTNRVTTLENTGGTVPVDENGDPIAVDVDLTNYYTIEQTDILLEGKYNKNETYTQSEVDQLLQDYNPLDRLQLTPLPLYTSDDVSGSVLSGLALAPKFTQVYLNRNILYEDEYSVSSDGTSITFLIDILPGDKIKIFTAQYI